MTPDAWLAIVIVLLVAWTATILLRGPSPRTAYVLVDSSVVARLERGVDGVRIVSRADFGDGLWLLRIESPRIPDNAGIALELVTWDTQGPVPVRFKRWLEV